MSERHLTLGTENIGMLLLKYATPSIVAMTASSVYNMMDSMFIGHGVGALAIAGLAVTFPFMNLAAAFGAMVGIGATTVVSMKLGQQDHEGAELAMGNVVLLNLIIGTLFAVVSLIFLDPILYFFGASDQTLPYAREYMVVILLGNVVTHLYRGLSDVMRASGYPKKSMYATIVSLIINAILNYLFIFEFGMGIMGAALSTVIAQMLALAYILYHFSKPSSLLHFKRDIFRFDRRIAGRVLSIGMSPFVVNALACFVVMLINNGLKENGGDLYIGAYGICNRVVFFFLMIVMGINQGMQPIVGYNYGARKFDRVIQTYKYTVVSAVALNTIGFLLCQFATEYVVSLFTKESDLIGICSHALCIMTVVLPLVGFQMVSNNFFQSIGKARIAIFLSTNRQLLFLIPCLLVLPRYYGADGIWWSLPISDMISVFVVLVMIIYQLREFKKERNE